MTGNTANNNSDGMNIGSGSTVIGNTSGVNSRDGFQIGNGSTIINNAAHANARFGFTIECRSNVIGNTAIFSGTQNLNLDITLGACNTEHNLTP